MRVLDTGQSRIAPELAYSPDCTTLATGIRKNYRTREVRLWDLTGDEPSRQLRVRPADFQPAYTFDELISGNRSSVPRVKVPRMAKHRSQRMSGCRALTATVYGFLVRYWASEFILSKPLTYRVFVVDEATSQEHPPIAWVLPGFSFEFTRIGLSADGRLVAVLVGHRIRIWRVETGTELATVSVRRLLPGGFAFSADGRYLGVLFQDSVSLYDTVSWQVARAYSWKIGKLRSLAFSPDGATAAVGSDKGKVVVFDLE